MEVIIRNVESGKVNLEGLFNWEEIEDYVKRVIETETGDKVKSINYNRFIEPQIAINSDGRITIRFYPVIQVLWYESKGDKKELFKKIHIQDADVILVLDRYTSKRLYQFLRSVEVSFFEKYYDDY